MEVVDKFCYLDDIQSVDRDADAAVEARFRIGWNKFRHLLTLLTNRETKLTITITKMISITRISLGGTTICWQLYCIDHLCYVK